MFLFGSLRTRHKGYKYRRSSCALVGVSGDGPPYSTPELAKRKEICPSEVAALGLPIFQQYASHELVNVRLLDNTIYPRPWASKYDGLP